MRLEDERALSHFLDVFVGSCDIVFRLATIHLLLILSDMFKTELAASPHEMCLLLVGSRHGVSVASLLQRKRLCRSISLQRKRKSRSETCILQQNETLTQNITTIDSKFLRCEDRTIVFSFALLASECIRSMSWTRCCSNEDQAAFDRHTPALTRSPSLGPACSVSKRNAWHAC